jgi:hypothetical protein
MTSRKFSSVLTLTLTLAASLALSSAGLAQTENASRDNTATQPRTPSIFHFSDGGNDVPGRMTTDAAGNFYIAATINSTTHVSGFAVLKYNGNGQLQHTFRYHFQPGESLGSALAVKLDQQNNIFALGTTGSGGLVTSFAPGGAQRWADRFDVEPIALAIDASGNIYVAGNGSAGGSDGVGPILDWLVVKYSNTGKVLWQQRHTGVTGQDSRVRDIQLDPSGNPVVYGTTSNNPANLTNNTTVAKFDPQGDLLWAQDFTVAHNQQVPGGLAIDRAGNVYTTSTTNPPEGIATPFTVKYDPNGNQQFVLQSIGGSSVAIDPHGDILLTGSMSNFGTPSSIAASKIHPSGQKVWTTQIPSTGKILSDASGNVFVAGFGFDITKLNSQGKIQFSTSVLPDDEETDALIDSLGNLLVTGFGQDAQFNDNIFTVRLK